MSRGRGLDRRKKERGRERESCVNGSDDDDDDDDEPRKKKMWAKGEREFYVKRDQNSKGPAGSLLATKDNENEKWKKGPGGCRIEREREREGAERWRERRNEKWEE